MYILVMIIKGLEQVICNEVECRLTYRYTYRQSEQSTFLQLSSLENILHVISVTFTTILGKESSCELKRVQQ
jgi:hypothetical protein